MADLLASGRLVDAILLIVLAEAGILVALARLRPGFSVAGILANLAAGALLLLALRSVLAGAHWSVTAAALAAAGLAHMADVILRWRT